jgi:hypothetical protein
VNHDAGPILFAIPVRKPQNRRLGLERQRMSNLSSPREHAVLNVPVSDNAMTL